MGRNSVEGYQGGNWPSTTGNPSGGGRGNAASSDENDDDLDLGANTGFSREIDERSCWSTVSGAFSEMGETSRLSMPSVPMWAVDYEGVITSFEHQGNQVRFRVDTENREFPFKLAEELVGCWSGQGKQHLHVANLIGDRVKFVAAKKPFGDNTWTRVHRFENLDWSEDRFDHDPYIYELENKLRSGDLGKRSIIRDPASEQNMERWFLMSGKYICRRVSFGTKEQAAQWMDSLGSYIQWREGSKFKINRNWFECSIVDANGNPPLRWSF